jgi:hypothetical protein
MAVLNRIAPGSAFKVGLVVYGFVGLLVGVFCGVAALAGMQFAPYVQWPFERGIAAMLGRGIATLIAVILCPMIYGLIGGFGAAIGAAIYNLASGWVGGVEVDIR